MKDKLIAQLYRRKRNSYYLTAIVGGYLVYLAWQIFGDLPQGSNLAAIAFWAAIVVFVICGVLLAALSFWALVKGYCVENAPADDEDPSTGK